MENNKDNEIRVSLTLTRAFMDLARDLAEEAELPLRAYLEEALKSALLAHERRLRRSATFVAEAKSTNVRKVGTWRPDSGEEGGQGEGKQYGSRQRKPYGQGEEGGQGEGKQYGSRQRKPYGQNEEGGQGERKQYGSRQRKPYGENEEGGQGERKQYGSRQRKPYGENEEGGQGERKQYGSRQRKPYGESEDGGQGKRKQYGSRQRKPFGQGSGKKPAGGSTSSGRPGGKGRFARKKFGGGKPGPKGRGD